MRSSYLLASFSAVAIGLLVPQQAPVPSALAKHHQALQDAQSLTAKVTLTQTGGGVSEVTFVFSKPGSFKVETPDTLAVYDGQKLTQLSKKANSYSETTATWAEAAKLALGDEQSAWTSFFSKDALKDVLAAKLTRKRVVKGTEYQEVELGFKPNSEKTMSLWLGADGVAKGFLFKNKSKDFIALGTEITLGKTALDASAFSFVAPAGAKKADPAVDGPKYADVQAIFDRSCMPCHGSGNPKAGFDLSSYEAVMGSRNAVFAGDPDRSFIIRSVKGDGLPLMPKNKPPLSKAEIDTISAWIKAGAKK